MAGILYFFDFTDNTVDYVTYLGNNALIPIEPNWDIEREDPQEYANVVMEDVSYTITSLREHVAKYYKCDINDIFTNVWWSQYM
jgi:hypothetical protein